MANQSEAGGIGGGSSYDPGNYLANFPDLKEFVSWLANNYGFQYAADVVRALTEGVSSGYQDPETAKDIYKAFQIEKGNGFQRSKPPTPTITNPAPPAPGLTAPPPATPPATTTPATPPATAPPASTTPPATNPSGLPEGYKVIVPNKLIMGPDGKYYDYNAYFNDGSLWEIDPDTAKRMQDEYKAPGATPSRPMQGPPKKIEQDGKWWWVYYDTDGNIVQVEPVEEEDKDLTPAQKAQLDLDREKWEWEKSHYGEMTPFEKAQMEEFERQKFATEYAGPRNWIQRWYYENAPKKGALPGKDWSEKSNLPLEPIDAGGNPPLDWSERGDMMQAQPIGVAGGVLSASQSPAPPPTPKWLTPYTGSAAGTPIQAQAAKMASGQSISKLAPSELQGLYGYVDWSAGRTNTPYASGEDWMYRSQALLPRKSVRPVSSWSSSFQR